MSGNMNEILEAAATGLLGGFIGAIVFTTVGIASGYMSVKLGPSYCSICHKQLVLKNTSTTICGHEFHTSCLFNSSTTSTDCPACKVQIVEKKPTVSFVDTYFDKKLDKCLDPKVKSLFDEYCIHLNQSILQTTNEVMDKKLQTTSEVMDKKLQSVYADARERRELLDALDKDFISLENKCKEMEKQITEINNMITQSKLDRKKT